MSATIQPVTADELLRMPDDGFRYELLKGELRKMPTAGNKHGRIASRVTGSLDPYVAANGLGAVYAAGTGFLISSDPDTVRASDVSFVSQAKLDKMGDMEGFLPGAPDLVIEVLSQRESYFDVEDAIFDFLAAGSQMVVVVNPLTRSVTVYRSLTDIKAIFEGDLLQGGDVVPGWSISVKDIFA